MTRPTIASLTADCNALRNDIGLLRAKVEEQRQATLAAERARGEAIKERQEALFELESTRAELSEHKGMIAMLERLGMIPAMEIVRDAYGNITGTKPIKFS